MRIVSLLPSATEIVCAIGLGDELVGVTHECDWPPEVASKPVMTRSVFDHAGRSSRDIHDLVGASVHSGSSLYALDEGALEAAEPDLILTQELCAVCAVSYHEVNAVVRSIDAEIQVVSLEPTTLEGIFNTISTVGAMTEAEDAAVDLVETLRTRLGAVEQKVQQRRDDGVPYPRVVGLEWLDPPFAVGHWVPEQIGRAGGWDLLGEAGQRSRETTWRDVADVDPEMLVLMPCGFHLRETVDEWERTPRPSLWREISAVRRGQVFAVDGSAYFSRPGPRVIDGIELLAEIFDPDAFVDIAPLGELDAAQLMPFRESFDCLWCGRAWQVRAPQDLEGWAQLCSDCLGRAGDNAFLRSRLRAAIAERGASADSAGSARGAPGVAEPPAAPPIRDADAEMRAYYAARAPEYDDWYLRRGRYTHGPVHDTAWATELDAAGRWLDGLPIRGEIVELAAGTGWWSPLLAEKGELSLYDANEAPLELARERLLAHGLRAHLHVRDAWAAPDRPVDALFAGFWLSHVPRGRLEAFLRLARAWLKPGGMFAAIDSLSDPQSGAADQPVAPPAGPDRSRRRLADGREFEIVKVHYRPEELRAALLRAGFSAAEVTTTGRFFVLVDART